MTISYILEDLANQIIVAHYFCLHFVWDISGNAKVWCPPGANDWGFYGCRLDLSVEAILISIHGTYVQRETRVLLFLYACVRRTRTILLLNTMTWSSPTESRKKNIFMFTNNIKVASHWWRILLDSTDIDLILSFLTHAIRGKWSPLLGIMDYSLPHHAISQITQLATL